MAKQNKAIRIEEAEQNLKQFTAMVVQRLKDRGAAVTAGSVLEEAALISYEGLIDRSIKVTNLAKAGQQIHHKRRANES